MVRLDALVFGYRKIGISPDNLSLVTSIFIRAGIISIFNADGTLTVKERDIVRVRSLLAGKVDFIESETFGLFGIYKRIEHKKTLLIASIVSIFMVILSSSVVWDIRIEGNERIPDSQIIMQLSRCGFSLGDFWSFMDRSEIESRFLKENLDISWININRRGTVAYVSVIESEAGNAKEEAPIGYANVVAEYDCIIEEITVKSGIAVVRPGDVVKKGDLLISGILSAESGGGLCYADGTVIGRMSDTVTVEVDREYEKKIRSGERLCDITVNFFDFSLNIFKIYGNSGKGCDIIENVKVFSLLGEKRLPFSVSTKHLAEYDVTRESYTDEQIVRVAGERLNAMTLARLAECDLLKIKTDGEYTDNGYSMTSYIVFLTDVGGVSKFSVE